MRTPEMRQRQTVTIPRDLVDNGARTAIQGLIKDAFDLATPADYTTPDFWNWKTTRGTFPKRLNKWLHTQGHKASNDFLGKVGSIAGMSVTDKDTFEYDFDNRINWHSGDFGDYGSCYWGSNSAAKDMLRDNGAFALRFFDENGHGCARSWVAPLGDGLWVLFNGYSQACPSGYGGRLDTLQQARILSHIVGGTYRQIDLENDGDDCGTLYINSGQGYLIGSFSDVENGPDNVDLDWNDYGTTCEDCGCRVHEDDCRSDDNGYSYCESCWNDRYAYCDACYEDFARDDATRIDGRVYCPDCRDDLFFSCEHCGDWTRNEDARRTDNGDHCQGCFDQYYTTCGSCDEAIPNREVQTIGGSDYCEDCAGQTPLVLGTATVTIDLHSGDEALPAVA